jgi:predicted 3-demethylubiquinone-9 3-methyltransferase (glyoxalase superfamily)
MKPKNIICLWFDKDAQEAARFYAATFPDSKVIAVHKAPSDYPGGKKGDVLTVEFTVVGIPCLGLNGGPTFKHSEAFSFQIATDNQEETDHYWNAIVGNGGNESACGWCKDRWGLSWQITPRTLMDALAAGGGEAKRAFEAMMTMRKIDVATIDAARRGDVDTTASNLKRRRVAYSKYLKIAGYKTRPILGLDFIKHVITKS